MGDCPKQYLEFHDMEEEMRAAWEDPNKGMKHYFIGDERISPTHKDSASISRVWRQCSKEEYEVASSSDLPRRESGFGAETLYFIRNDGVEVRNVPFKEVYATFEDFAKSYHGYDSPDEETGRYGYWENPNRKWDWWVVGGRWSGALRVKPNSKDVFLGNRSWTNEDENIGPLNVDSCLIGDIDFEGMHEDARVKAEKTWVNAEEKDKKYGLNEQMRKFLYGINVDDTRESYVERCASRPFTTFAVLKGGQWYERGEMGWWGVVSNEMSVDEWNEQFSKLVKELPADTRVWCVDCHI